MAVHESSITLALLTDVLSFAGLSQHEILTVARAYQIDSSVSDGDTLIAVVQDNLRKKVSITMLSFVLKTVSEI